MNMLHNLKILFYIVLLINTVNASKLLEIINNALNTNNSYMSAITSYKSSNTQLATAKSYLYPNISFEASANKIIESPNKGVATKKESTIYSYGITLVQPIMVLEALGEVTKLNHALVQAQLEVSSKKNDLIIEIITLYLESMKIQDSLELLKIEYRNLLDQKKIVEARIRLGLVKSIDLQEINLQESTLNYNRLALENNLKLTLNNLKSVTQSSIVPSSNIAQSNISNVPILNQNVNQWQEIAKSYNLDLLKLKLALKIAEKEIDIANYALLPTINGVASYKNEFGSVPQVSDYDQNKLSVGVNLSMNLFAGGRDHSRNKKVKLNKQESQYNLLAAIDKINNSVEYNYNTLSNLINQLDTLQISLSQANNNYKSAQKSYSLGLKSNNDVLLAMEKYSSVQNQLLSVKYEILLSMSKLYGLIGEISEDNILIIDRYLLGKD